MGVTRAQDLFGAPRRWPGDGRSRQRFQLHLPGCVMTDSHPPLSPPRLRSNSPLDLCLCVCVCVCVCVRARAQARFPGSLLAKHYAFVDTLRQRVTSHCIGTCPPSLTRHTPTPNDHNRPEPAPHDAVLRARRRAGVRRGPRLGWRVLQALRHHQQPQAHLLPPARRRRHPARHRGAGPVRPQPVHAGLPHRARRPHGSAAVPWRLHSLRADQQRIQRARRQHAGALDRSRQPS